MSTNRMGSEPEFAKWINEEVAIGIMQKIAKTGSFDQNVSIVNVCLCWRKRAQMHHFES